MKGLLCFLLVALALLAIPQSAAASPLNYTEWTVNATFTNGDVATGFFDLDTTGTVFNWNIQVTGGNFSAVTYVTGGFETNNQFGVCSGCAHDFAFFSGPNAGRYTDFVTTTALPLTSGGPETLDSVNTLDSSSTVKPELCSQVIDS